MPLDRPDIPSLTGRVSSVAPVSITTALRPCNGRNMDCQSSDKNRRITAGLCVFFVLMVWSVFSQTLSFDFVNDDDRYVYADSSISAGVTLQGLRRIILHPHTSADLPFSHAGLSAVCTQSGRTSPEQYIILHIETVLLLFLVLKSMTGFMWRSAFVAALFAVHPLQIESVAWISERKDVLSVFFFMLTLSAYLHYIAFRRYLSVLLLFTLGLLAKPMLVTIPFVLLLGWRPLKRFAATGKGKTAVRLWIEKIPFLFLSAGSCCQPVCPCFIRSTGNRPLSGRWGYH